MGLSPLDQLAVMDDADRDAYLDSCTAEELALIASVDWSMTARPEQLPPEGDWLGWFLKAGRGFGKLLSLFTPIATPYGFVPLGAIEVGDAVFAPDGEPTEVLAVYDAFPERAWSIKFFDGTIVAGGEHLWAVHAHQNRKAFNRRKAGWPQPWWAEAQVLDTDALAAGQTFGPRGDREWSIPLTAPLRGLGRMGIDPWCVGYWLGNGSRNQGQVTTHADDMDEVAARFEAAGFPCPGAQVVQTPSGSHAGSMTPYGWITELKQCTHLVPDKKPPDSWLFAVEPDRRALLAGLLDSDGHAGVAHIEFCSTDQHLAVFVHQLVRSLGERPILAEGRATLNGRDMGPKWRVTWSPLINPCILRRKAYYRKGDGQASRLTHRMIESITPHPIVPMRCITVAHESGLFLAGEALIPTHNTRGGAEWTKDQIDRLSHHPDVTNGVRWALVAPTFADIRDTMVEGTSGLKSILPPSMLLDGSWEKAWNRSLAEINLADGGRIKGFSSEKPDRLRGPQHHGAWVDEPAYLKDAFKGTQDDTTWSNLLLGLRLPPDPRVVITGTPKRNRLIIELCDDPDVVVVVGSTYENLSNLSAQFRQRVVARYAGTRLGRQELEAELLEGIGEVFQWGWFHVADALPWRPTKIVRYWDLAATEPHEGNQDPDWTAGAKVAIHEGTRQYAILHVVRFRLNTGARDDEIRMVAEADGPRVGVWIEQGRGADGKSVVANIGKHLDGVARVKGNPAQADKTDRAELWAGAAQQGRVTIVRAGWDLIDLKDEMEEFPNGSHDDMCLPAGTLVQRPDGPCPIEHVQVGDLVLGRSGWVEVSRSWSTGVLPVLTRFGLRATANHPYWTENRGWVPFLELRHDDTLLACDAPPRDVIGKSRPKVSACAVTSGNGDWTKASNPRIDTPVAPSMIATIRVGTSKVCALSTTHAGSGTEIRSSWKPPNGGRWPWTRSSSGASPFAGTPTPIEPRTGSTTPPGGSGSNRGWRRCIEKYGRTLTDLSRRAGTFTTGIETSRTTRSTIWSASPKRSIRKSTPRNDPNTADPPSNWPIWNASVPWLPLGIHRRRASSGTASTDETSPPRDGVRERVYNLTTTDGTYFADGVLVHNCDAVSGAFIVLGVGGMHASAETAAGREMATRRPTEPIGGGVGVPAAVRVTQSMGPSGTTPAKDRKKKRTRRDQPGLAPRRTIRT